MCGAGEYNCGYVPTAAGAAADKRCGVTAIVLFDLRRQGRVGRILLADADGARLPLARACMQEKIGEAYKGMDVSVESWPKDEASGSFDAGACAAAMDTMQPGDAVIIFTPDPTHMGLASAAIARGLHVLVAKPIVKLLAEHVALAEAAAAAGVLCAVEYHKRWDPIYNDARERARGLGDFSFFSSMMTQRKAQLDTFAAWAGKSSDISFYLNSHHIDILCWMLEGRARPEQVSAAASFGVADARLQRANVEDTITLMVTVSCCARERERVRCHTLSLSLNNCIMRTHSSARDPARSHLPCHTFCPLPPSPSPLPVVQFRNASGSSGHAIFTSSWVAPTADCHTQQGFHYMGHAGEIRCDQAHRGYSMSSDAPGATGSLAGGRACRRALARAGPSESSRSPKNKARF
jgi:D-galacturonate reductase